MEHKFQLVAFNKKIYLVSVAEFRDFDAYQPSDDVDFEEPNVISEDMFRRMISDCSMFSRDAVLHHRCELKRPKFLSRTSDMLRRVTRRFSKAGSGRPETAPFSLCSDDESCL